MTTETGYHSIREVVDFHDQLKASAGIEPINIRISYPGRAPQYGPLEELQREIRNKVKGHEDEIDKEVQVKRIADFFGLTGHVELLPSAGDALGLALQYFTKAGDQVLLPEPAYAFDNWVKSLADGTRTVSRIGHGLQTLETLTNNGSKKRTFIIETPRRNSFLEHDNIVYSLLAKSANRDSLVIYDGVNSFYGVDTVVQRGKDGNKLLRYTGPIADRSIRIDGTSKLFHEGFQNLAIAQISDALYKEDPEKYERFKEFITRTTYNTRTKTDVYVMAELLNDKKFGYYLGSIKALARENSLYVKDALKDIAGVEFDGPNVFIEVDKTDFGESPEFIADYLREYYGIHAMNSYQYFTQSYNLPTFIRLPMMMDRSKLEKIVITLRKKLLAIQSTPRIPMERTNEEIYF